MYIMNLFVIHDYDFLQNELKEYNVIEIKFVSLYVGWSSVPNRFF